MPESTIHPSGDKIRKAVQELSDLIKDKPDKSRRQLLQQVAMKFDLSPSESAFLERQFLE